MKAIDLPPFAPILIESTRAIGYSLEAAIADIIDNSIAADASNVHVCFFPVDEPYLAIIDDGCGMDDEEITQAMQYGSANPLEERSRKDLGRFGLGLKTASLSQCRQLTVVSKKGSHYVGRRWDIDFVNSTGKWSLIVLNEEEIWQLECIDTLQAFPTGTMVLWKNLDRMQKGEINFIHSMGDKMEEVGKHLSLVYHRYISGESGIKKLTIYMNGEKLAAADPFLQKRSFQAMADESYVLHGEKITIRPYILPHISKLTAKEIALLGGKDGLRKQQGFYIYRNKRLLVWGTWFRMMRQGDLSKLARIQVDIPNTLDDLWTLDIKKSTAIPPPELRKCLETVIQNIAEKSKQTWVFRGKKEITDQVQHVWNRLKRPNGDVLYEINRDHPLVSASLDAAADRGAIETLLRQIEQSLPVNQLYVDMNADEHFENEIQVPKAEVKDIIHTYKDRIRKFKYHIFTDASVSATIKTVETQPIGTIPTDCQVWSLERLFRICSSDLARQSIEIDFSQFTAHGIPCLPVFDASTDDFHSYLCVIPGKILADIYDEYGSALLEGNVRSFLSTKVAVNKKIRETILSKPDRFFAFNNGISATALNVELADTPQGRFVTKVKDFQIINGGQTTASLSNARFRDKADLSSIFVQMKLTEIDETDADKSTELIRNISKSSNSQNKVSDADFFATSPFHIRMEQFSRRMFANASDGSQYETHWFYERARGQYLQAQMRLTPAKKKQFQMQNPKNQLITKTDLAKVMVTWRGRPDIVSRGAQTCFMWFANITDAAWEEDNEQFNEKYYQEAVALTIMHRYLEKAIPMQHWYESGYRANVITYSIASLHHLLSKQKAGLKLDLAMIWIRQTVPDVLCSVLLHIAEIVYSLITSEDRKVVNVTQWCKREECWKYVLAHMSYKLPDEIDSCLCSTDAQKSQERSARKVQRIDSGVEYQKRVLEHDALFWGRLAQFAASKRLLNESSASALKLVVRLPEKLPNSVQCAKLLELLEAAKSEGFKEQE